MQAGEEAEYIKKAPKDMKETGKERIVTFP